MGADLRSIGTIALAFLAIYALADTEAFRAADRPPNGDRSRVSPLDGLRGVLALLVVFHHTDLWRQLARAGRFTSSSRMFDHAGPIGVSMFFMITGTLFFDKLIVERGRPRWLPLYVGRVFRIAPVYGLAFGLLLLETAIRSGFTLHVGLPVLAREIGIWALLGIGPQETPLNGDPGAYMDIAGVTWSLRDEWGFYAAMPVLGLLCRGLGPRARLAATAALLIASAIAATLTAAPEFPPSLAAIGVLFSVGMFSAALRRSGLRLPTAPQGAATLVTIAVLAMLLRFHNIYTAPALLLVAIPFLLVTQGATMNGLLISRPARRVGDVSYPIYLLHGLVLSTMLHVPALHGVLAASESGFPLLAIGVASLVLVAATLTHVGVERPGIALGRRIVGRVATATDARNRRAPAPEHAPPGRRASPG